jgi:hypothetical protein
MTLLKSLGLSLCVGAWVAVIWLATDWTIFDLKPSVHYVTVALAAFTGAIIAFRTPPSTA